MNLMKNVKVDQVLGYYAAGTTKRTSDIIDMAGYEGVMFVFELGTTLDTGTVKAMVEGNATNSTSGMAELAGCPTVTITAATAATKSAIVVDVFRPDPKLHQFLQASITPAVANAVVLGITAIRYSGRVRPDSVAGLLASAQLVSPAAA
ncbi:hypothetical protein KP003_16680 [Geomonas nitrogeniifigens]|uniref:hypothetical protein n=1 Tax=Geomonas diazotrophica TaxID=2843197 RepID=UPI001C2B84AC|nr:hypothetical protein [Geomonas nitrogeniifigens]QXE85977.1 hypothetical protein KP003_16680 [Geomonas nitrogeniifigens]